MKRRIKQVLIGLLLFLLAAFILFACQIDDWSRDLTTNFAETSVDATDPLMRPLQLSATTEEVQDAIQSFVGRNGNWDAGEPVVESEAVRVPLTRSTRVFRFVDDVEVRIQTTAEGTEVHVSSQSRVGKGDLGQNPRNIRELLKALQEELVRKN